jgi:isoleucyl-tRNA synthetase
LQARVKLLFNQDEDFLLTPEEWAEVLIVSAVELERSTVGLGGIADPEKAPGEKCARCWRVLPEVGENPRHPSLCRRCADAVESGLVYRAAAE